MLVFLRQALCLPGCRQKSTNSYLVSSPPPQWGTDEQQFLTILPRDTGREKKRTWKKKKNQDAKREVGCSFFSLPPCGADRAVVRGGPPTSHFSVDCPIASTMPDAEGDRNFSRPSNLLWTLGPKDSFDFPLPCPAPYTCLNYNPWVSTMAKIDITDSFQEYSLIKITQPTGLALFIGYSPSSSHLVNFKTLEGREHVWYNGIGEYFLIF